MAHIGQGSHCHRRTIGITPLIGHKEYLIDRRTDGGEVVALIQCSRLIGGNFGGQGGDNRIAQGIEPLCEAAQKCGIGPRILGVDIFKIHIQPPVALLHQHGLQIVNQRILYRRLSEGQVGQLIGEAALFGQGGQVHQRSGSTLAGCGEQGLVIQLHQRAVRGKAIGKGGQIGEVRDGGLE